MKKKKRKNKADLIKSLQEKKIKNLKGAEAETDPKTQKFQKRRNPMSKNLKKFNPCDLKHIDYLIKKHKVKQLLQKVTMKLTINQIRKRTIKRKNLKNQMKILKKQQFKVLRVLHNFIGFGIIMRKVILIKTHLWS